MRARAAWGSSVAHPPVIRVVISSTPLVITGTIAPARTPKSSTAPTSGISTVRSRSVTSRTRTNWSRRGPKNTRLATQSSPPVVMITLAMTRTVAMRCAGNEPANTMKSPVNPASVGMPMTLKAATSQNPARRGAWATRPPMARMLVVRVRSSTAPLTSVSIADANPWEQGAGWPRPGQPTSARRWRAAPSTSGRRSCSR